MADAILNGLDLFRERMGELWEKASYLFRKTGRAARQYQVPEKLRGLGEVLLKDLFQVEANGRLILAMPVGVLVLALVFALRLVAILLIVGLVLGADYHLQGGSWTYRINDLLEGAADLVAGLKESLLDRR